MDNLDLIKEQFDKIIKHSQDIPKVNTQPLFDKWLAAKQWYIDAFGGELIWKSPEPITFNLDKTAKQQKVDEFVDYVYNYNRELSNFIYINKDGFFENKVVSNEDDTKVPKGMKLTRAFKFFENDPRLLDTFQTKASMILQEDKVTGYLCLSVHPLDFLTTSENASGWRSCHALDGEFRCGNLSYMCDSSTVVCYLASEKDAPIPHGPEGFIWNNKKWRALLFFSENKAGVFAGRQYPFMTTGSLDYMKDVILKTIWTKMYKDKTGRSYYWNIEDVKELYVRGWYNESIKSVEHADGRREWLINTYIPIEAMLYPKTQIITHGTDYELFYNDLLSSTVYENPYYMWFDLERVLYIRNNWKWVIGANVPCVCCGEDHAFISESMLCENCEDRYGNCDNSDYYVFCECCGARLRRDSDEAILLATGEWLCDICADKLATCCEACGDWYYNDDIRFDKKAGEYRCEYCYSGEVSDFYE